MKRYCLCVNTRLNSAPCVRCVANAVRHNHHLFRQSLLSVSVLIVCVTELRTHQKPNRSNRRRSSSRRRIEKLHNKRDLHILFANSSSGNVFSTSILIRRRRSDWENMKKFVKNRLRTNKWYAKKANTDKKKNMTDKASMYWLTSTLSTSIKSRSEGSFSGKWNQFSFIPPTTK